tara:strand:+ start:74 stop:442 length:369 start_codon:yes stop_codon:yes gene_type:complete
MEAISMKCTREQYESIKHIIGDLDNESEDDFYTFKYLHNYEDTRPQMYNKTDGTTLRKIYHEFNKDIFLKACDLECPKAQGKYNQKSHWTNDFLKSTSDIKEIELTRLQIEIILGYKIKIVK